MIHLWQSKHETVDLDRIETFLDNVNRYEIFIEQLEDGIPQSICWLLLVVSDFTCNNEPYLLIREASDKNLPILLTFSLTSYLNFFSNIALNHPQLVSTIFKTFPINNFNF